MGNNGKDFMDARPWYRSPDAPFGKFNDDVIRFVVPWGIFPMGINKNIRIDGDHPPRPS
jgi:hypothetical protein